MVHLRINPEYVADCFFRWGRTKTVVWVKSGHVYEGNARGVIRMKKNCETHQIGCASKDTMD